MHWKGGGAPLPGRPAYAQPPSPSRLVPASMEFVTDSNRPQPFWRPPPTACLTISGATFEAPSLLMNFAVGFTNWRPVFFAPQFASPNFGTQFPPCRYPGGNRCPLPEAPPALRGAGGRVQ